KSQDRRHSNTVEAKFQKAIGYFPSNYGLSGVVWGGEFAYNISTRNETKSWARKLSIKSIDIVLDYKNLQNLDMKNQKNKFGDSYSIHSGLSFVLYKNNFIELGLSPSLGLGYTDQTFYTNGNEILGSKINLYSRAVLSIEAPVS